MLQSGETLAKNPSDPDCQGKAIVHGSRAHNYRLVLDILDDILTEDSSHLLLPLETIAIQV